MPPSIPVLHSGTTATVNAAGLPNAAFMVASEPPKSITESDKNWGGAFFVVRSMMASGVVAEPYDAPAASDAGTSLKKLLAVIPLSCGSKLKL